MDVLGCLPAARVATLFGLRKAQVERSQIWRGGQEPASILPLAGRVLVVRKYAGLNASHAESRVTDEIVDDAWLRRHRMLDLEQREHFGIMSTYFNKYLVTEVLSEQRTLSYRNLARAQKVHANAAKCMLYEFYETQTKRKPGSLYATYLIAGVKKEQPTPNGIINGAPHDEDEPMPSSPPPFTSSMLDPSQQESEGGRSVPRKTITLAREEAMAGRAMHVWRYQKLTWLDVRAQYETITSIHIYSLSSTKLPDLATLTDIGRGLYTDVFAKEDPLLHNKTYGIIQNPQVRRRKGKRPVVSSAPAPKFQPAREQPKSQPVKEQTKPIPAATRPKPALKKEETVSPSLLARQHVYTRLKGARSQAGRLRNLQIVREKPAPEAQARLARLQNFRCAQAEQR